MKNHFKLFLGILVAIFITLIACHQEKKKPTVFNIPEGFELEDLFSPSEAGMGS